MIRLFDHQRQARVRLAQMRQNTTDSALLSSSNLLFCSRNRQCRAQKKCPALKVGLRVWFRELERERSEGKVNRLMSLNKSNEL